MKFSIKNFFSKCDQIRSFLWIWSHLLKKLLIENFIFCAVFLDPREQFLDEELTSECGKTFLKNSVDLILTMTRRYFQA